MKKAGVLLLVCSMLYSPGIAQVKNVNIAGSYQGVFTLSGSSDDYKIGGSPYLSEEWMYGTIEMEKPMISKSRDTLKASDQEIHQGEIINKCNDLIQKISDPKFQAIAFKLTMAEINKLDKEGPVDVEFSNDDFEGLPEIVEEFREKLLSFLAEQRAEYMSNIRESNKINGLFRYNLYAQEFEMIFEGDTFAIKAPLDVRSISFSNKKFIFGFYFDREFGHDYLGSSYFEVLCEGRCKLLIRHDVKIKSNSGPVTYAWAGDGSDSFVKFKQLFYQEKDGSEVLLLKKTRKNLRKIFADKYAEVEWYIRNEKINVKKDSDLIKVFKYYNNLDS